jgi:hypothetical protein
LSGTLAFDGELTSRLDDYPFDLFREEHEQKVAGYRI